MKKEEYNDFEKKDDGTDGKETMVHRHASDDSMLV
jgi:hypothetical protein